MLNLLKKLFPSAPQPLACFGRTDTGLVRDHNEDSFCILEEQRLFMVADGMGGHNAGEVASRVAIEALIDSFTPAVVKQMDADPEQTRRLLIAGFTAANQRVMAMAGQHESMRGMGCTLVVSRIDDRFLHTCHVGDARCYLCDGEKLVQITTDHTGVTYQRPREGDRPQPRPVVTMAIGFPFQQEPEYNRTPLAAGQRVLLCSDGLWSMVAENQILATLTAATTPEQAANELVRLANQAGGRDNVTALVVFC